MGFNKISRWLAVALAMALFLSLFSCGGKKEDTASGTQASVEALTEASSESERATSVEAGDTEVEATSETETTAVTETETDAPQVKCKHKNASLSVEHGCVMWCPDCESPAGAKAYHKNKLTYVNGEGYYSICSECSQRSGDGKKYLVEWDAEALGALDAAGIVGVYNADGGYTRFEGDGKTSEAYMQVVPADEANYEVTGQYLMIKYRTNVSEFVAEGETEPNYVGNIQIYCSTTTAKVESGRRIDFKGISDGEWHIAVLDLADGVKYAPDADGYYAAKNVRLDLINPQRAVDKDAEGNVIKEYAPLPEGYYMDVAFVAMCDDPDAFVSYFESNEGDKALCNHAVNYVNDDCMEACAGCGREYGEKHTYDFTVEEDGGSSNYVMSCLKCDNELSYTVDFGDKAPEVFFDPKYIADAAANGNRMGNSEFYVEDGVGFLRLHANTAVNGEGTFFLIDEGSALETGRYMVIKYRTECSDNWEIFVGNEGTKATSSSHFYIETTTSTPHCDPICADGEWRLMFIDLSSVNGSAVKENNGKYVLGHLRWDIFNIPGTSQRHIDVAYVAFSDDAEVLKAINGDFVNCCSHVSFVGDFSLVTDELDSTDTPMKKGICAICGAEAVTKLDFIFNVEKLSGSDEIKSGRVNKFDLGFNGVTASADNTFTVVSGWQGVDFVAEQLAYRVYDENGNLLSDGWTVFDGRCRTLAESDAVVTAVSGAGINGANSRRFDNLTVDLSEYFATCDNVTIEYAFVLRDIPEGSNDRFVSFLTVTNIAKAN